MSTKQCKIKLCSCFGAVKDTGAGKSNKEFLTGIESGVVDALSVIPAAQEDRFFALVDDVVSATGKGSAKDVKEAAQAVSDFVMNLA